MDRNLRRDEQEEKSDLTFSDIVAFMIAAFQIFAPAALILMGVLILFYFLVRWWAG